MMNKSFMRHLGHQCLMLLGVFLIGGGVARADQIMSVPVDSATEMKIKGVAKDVIIANPSIADVTLQSPDHFVIIGRQPGRTTLLILGPDHEILLNRMIVVSEGNEGLLTVHGPRGGTMSRDSYACGQHCTLIPGSNVGGSNGGGSLGSGPSPTDATPADPNANRVTKVDSKVKLKISPNGDVTGTRTEVPQYGQ
jgi:hypothetical protein